MYGNRMVMKGVVFTILFHVNIMEKITNTKGI